MSEEKIVTTGGLEPVEVMDAGTIDDTVATEPEVSDNGEVSQESTAAKPRKRGRKNENQEATELTEEEVDQKIQEMQEALAKSAEERARKRADAERMRAEGERSRAQRRADIERMREEETQRHSVISSLRSAMNTFKPVTVTTHAIEVLYLNNEAEVCATSMLAKGVKVVIPFPEMFADDPVQEHDDAPTGQVGRDQFITRKKNFIAKCLDAEVSCLVTDILADEDEDLVYVVASRRQHQIAEMRRNFSGKNPRIRVGDFVAATVLSVSRYGVMIHIGGADIHLKLRDITYAYVTDLTERLRPGDTLTVEIRSITEQEDGTFNIWASALGTEMRHGRENGHLLPVGSDCNVVVSRVFVSKNTATDDGPQIYAWHDAYNLPVRIVGLPASFNGNPPQPGSRVRVKVFGHSNAGFVLARCQNLYGGMGPAYDLLRQRR